MINDPIIPSSRFTSHLICTENPCLYSVCRILVTFRFPVMFQSGHKISHQISHKTSLKSPDLFIPSFDLTTLGSIFRYLNQGS